MVFASVGVLPWMPFETSLSRNDLVLQDLSLTPALDAQPSACTVLLVACGTSHHLSGEAASLHGEEPTFGKHHI